MRLIHFSAEPLKEVYSVPQEVTSQFKPKGLWVSVESEKENWVTFCNNEHFSVKRFKFSTTIELVEDNNILLIDRPDKFLKFFKEFKELDKHKIDFYVNWKKVSKQYDGIIISPYMWEFRLSHIWYYTWDCASGCIWNPKSIKQNKSKVVNLFKTKGV